jgi:uncharacterized protein
VIPDDPYTYDELDELFRGEGHNDIVGLSHIDGLIAALVAGPTVVPKEQWLPLIFKNRMPSSIEGSPESRSAATILARYAEVRQKLTERPADYQPIFMHHHGRSIIRPWAIGFMLGLGQDAEAWTPLLLGLKRRDLIPILVHSELGRPMLPDISDAEVARIAAQSEPPEIAGAVVKAHAFFVARDQPRKLHAIRRPTRRSFS